MKLALVSIAGFGLLAFSAHAQPPAGPDSSQMEFAANAALDRPEPAAAPGARQGRIQPPADLEGDDSGEYMKHMTSAELEKLYARHDAEVARLMAAAPDDPLLAALEYVDPETGERTSIDLIAF